MSISKKFFLFISLLLVFLGHVYAAERSGMRGERYCEILVGKKDKLTTHVQVYNTIGLNNCPAKQWDKITVDAVKKQTDASFVHLNGPRYWVIDGFVNTTLINPEPKEFGGLKMRDAGILKLGIVDLLGSDKSYKKHQVKRQTTWVYEAGKPIYEIINSKGEIFVMQSYSVQKNKEQNEKSLANLGSQLQLPKGWTFRTRILKQDAHLTPINQEAVVIQDNYLNTYQQETPDFISHSGAKSV